MENRLRAVEISLSAMVERMGFHTQQISCIKTNVERLVEKIENLTVEMARASASKIATRRTMGFVSAGISIAISIAGVIVAILV